MKKYINVYLSTLIVSIFNVAILSYSSHLFPKEDFEVFNVTRRYVNYVLVFVIFGQGVILTRNIIKNRADNIRNNIIFKSFFGALISSIFFSIIIFLAVLIFHGSLSNILFGFIKNSNFFFSVFIFLLGLIFQVFLIIMYRGYENYNYFNFISIVVVLIQFIFVLLKPTPEFYFKYAGISLIIISIIHLKFFINKKIKNINPLSFEIKGLNFFSGFKDHLQIFCTKVFCCSNNFNNKNL